MASSKDAQELKQFCERHPAVARVDDGTKHWLVYPKDKSLRPVRIPRTPSDWRWYENCKSELRRAGIDIPRKGGKKQKKQKKQKKKKKKKGGK